MIESQFAELSRRIFPKLQQIVELERGSRNGAKQRTYLHKTMLRKVYSADQKWSSASVDTTYVKADLVALNSPLPIKRRDSLAHASGVLPKHGISRVMEESDINTINIMKAQGAEWSQIATKLTSDPVFCSVGIDESNEAAFLTALSEGVVAVADANNVGTALRVDFGYKEENGFGTEIYGELSLDDIERVIAGADAKGDTITTIAIAMSTYKKLRQTRGAKELVATYRGQSFTDGSSLPTPTSSLFDEAFADAYNGIQFLKIDRSVVVEKNGTRQSYKPFNPNRVIYLTSEMVGSFVWGTLAEKTNGVEGVVYTTIDDHKLISRFRTTNPLTETTAGQSLSLPVIENVDQIYWQDLTIAVEDKNPEEGALEIGSTPVGDRAGLISKLKEYGVNLKSNASDEAIVKAINTQLTKTQREELLAWINK